MGTDSKRQLLTATIITILIFVTLTPVLSVEALNIRGDLNAGPYVDRIIYRIVTQYDQRILDIQSGAAEILSSYILPDDLSDFNSYADISLSDNVRNGYGHITINCNKYPLNISAFRRAFAHAFDKERVKSQLLPVGLVSQEHDSVVPYSSSWCIEDDLRYHYYAADVARGELILNAYNFSIDPVTGYRRAPDGSPFNVSIEWTDETILAANAGTVVTQAAVDALTALGIDATIGPAWPHLDNLTKKIDNNQDFDMAFYAYNFQNTDVDWLGYHFWGELIDVPFANPCNYRNAEYDSWRERLLRSTDYDEVYRAAAAMQEILHYTVPMVVVYENISKLAYRNDLFTGHIEDPLRGIGNHLNLRNMRRIDGTPNGTVSVAISNDPDTFNIYLDANEASSQIMAQLWPSLFLQGPDLNPVPYLATNMKIETHTDNPSVPYDHTRFTIDIVQNAIWTDDTPLTAEDVVYSFIYAYESGVFGNPAGESLSNLVSAYNTSNYRAVFEFESESYWHFSDFAFDYIIPKHVYEPIGYESWNSYDPVFVNTTQEYVTAGPFRLEQVLSGEFVELSVNPDFWYHPLIVGPTFPDSSTISLVIGAGIVVIVVISALRKKGVI